MGGVAWEGGGKLRFAVPTRPYGKDWEWRKEVTQWSKARNRAQF